MTWHIPPSRKKGRMIDLVLETFDERWFFSDGFRDKRASADFTRQMGSEKRRWISLGSYIELTVFRFKGHKWRFSASVSRWIKDIHKDINISPHKRSKSFNYMLTFFSFTAINDAFKTGSLKEIRCILVSQTFSGRKVMFLKRNGKIWGNVFQQSPLTFISAGLF